MVRIFLRRVGRINNNSVFALMYIFALMWEQTHIQNSGFDNDVYIQVNSGLGLTGI